MRKRTIWLAVALLCLTAAVASAQTFHFGELVLTAEGGFTPTTLPKHEDAPITVKAGGQISTVSGKLPPIVQTLTAEFDRHTSIQTEGLEICTASKLQATTPAAARRTCPGAIVGEGTAKAIVQFPESNPIPISSPVTIFNGPPKHGDQTVIAHAYTTVPVPTTFIVPVVIEPIHNGVYGYRTKATIPRIAGGAGHPLSAFLKVGRKWTYKGVKHSYLNARCETGHLQARVELTLQDEGTGPTALQGAFVRPCKARP